MKAETGHSEEGANTTLTSEEMRAQREAELAEVAVPKVSKRGGRTQRRAERLAFLQKEIPARKGILAAVVNEGGPQPFHENSRDLEGELRGLTLK